MKLHSVVMGLVITTFSALACATVETPAPELASQERADDQLNEAVGPSLRGVYRVQGSALDGDVRRVVSGYVVIREVEDGYVSSYSLRTQHQSRGLVTSGELIGYGRGRLAGGDLRETTRIQSVVSAAAGVDVRFPFVPRKVSPRMVSHTTGRLEADGSIALEIEGSGEDAGHGPLHLVTRLEGRRIEPTELPASVRSVVLTGSALARR